MRWRSPGRLCPRTESPQSSRRVPPRPRRLNLPSGPPPAVAARAATSSADLEGRFSAEDAVWPSRHGAGRGRACREPCPTCAARARCERRDSHARAVPRALPEATLRFSPTTCTTRSTSTTAPPCTKQRRGHVRRHSTRRPTTKIARLGRRSGRSPVMTTSDAAGAFQRGRRRRCCPPPSRSSRRPSSHLAQAGCASSRDGRTAAAAPGEHPAASPILTSTTRSTTDAGLNPHRDDWCNDGVRFWVSRPFYATQDG
jgi:hypothetical protein